MISEESIEMIKKLSQECKKCEECPYYLPDMPDDDQCLFALAPCTWNDYLKRTVGYKAKEEESKMEEIKKVIKEYYEDACCGIFDCRNLVGDPMETIYDDGKVQIDICYSWMYFEVFGLTDEEFEELAEYYHTL